MSSIGRGLPAGLASRHAPREASGGAYTMFEPSQVKQFREAFAVIDQDGDGRVSKEDLRIMLSSLGESAQARLIPGQTPTPNLLETLLTDPSGKRVETINFTQFLSMMGQHLLQLDAEQDLLEAFASFDDEDKGWVKVDDVRKALQEMGDRMNAQEVCMYCVN